jgi:hypothetical protein
MRILRAVGRKRHLRLVGRPEHRKIRVICNGRRLASVVNPERQFRCLGPQLLGPQIVQLPLLQSEHFALNA